MNWSSYRKKNVSWGGFFWWRCVLFFGAIFATRGSRRETHRHRKLCFGEHIAGQVSKGDRIRSGRLHADRARYGDYQRYRAERRLDKTRRGDTFDRRSEFDSDVGRVAVARVRRGPVFTTGKDRIDETRRTSGVWRVGKGPRVKYLCVLLFRERRALTSLCV